MARIKQTNKFYENKIFQSKSYGDFKVLKYNNTFNVEIEFLTTGYKTSVQLSNVKSGSVRDPYYPIVYGVGYMGEGPYKSRPVQNGPQSRCYKIWKEMLGRCYCNSTSSFINYGACGVVVCSEWHNFQNYAKWYYKNCINESYCVDKDFLGKGLKIYSPTTCCFIPEEINAQLTLRQSRRGKFPLGVRPCGKKYQAQLNKNSKKIPLGVFNTIEEAFNAYKTAKETFLKELADKYKATISEEVYYALKNFQININD